MELEGFVQEIVKQELAPTLAVLERIDALLGPVPALPRAIKAKAKAKAKVKPRSKPADRDYNVKKGDAVKFKLTSKHAAGRPFEGIVEKVQGKMIRVGSNGAAHNVPRKLVWKA